MINMSQIITDIIFENGLYQITLPFKDKQTGQPIPTEQFVQEAITSLTIPKFSQFVPWEREGEINVAQMEVVDRGLGIYLLPRWLTQTPVMSVISIHLPFHNNRGMYGSIAPAYGIQRSVQGVAAGQAYMMVAGQMRAEPTWDYLGENKVRLYGYPKTLVNIKVACQHEPNGETIPHGCYDSFLELAKLDTQVALYNNLKYYNNLPSAHGTVNLNIDDFKDAIAKRDEWLKDAGDKFHVDMDYWGEWM